MSTDALDVRPPITADDRRDENVACGPRTRTLDVWLPGAALSLIVLACFAGPIFLPAPVGGDIRHADRPMWSPHHLLGTDMIGNDVLARVLAGGRLSLEVAVGSNALGLALGGLVGIYAGFARGWADRVTTSVLDVLMAFPSLVFAMVVAAGLGPGESHVMVALAVFSVPAYARLARAATLKIREETFVHHAGVMGMRPARTVLTHVVPNVMPQLLTFACLGLSVSVMLEASLSFLGLGVRPPAPSWGSMIVQGQEYLTTRPSLVVIPSAFLTVTLLALNSLAEAVRRRLAQR